MEARVWHQHYDQAVPPSLEYPQQTAADFLRQTADQMPDNIALIFGSMAPWLGEQHQKMNYRKLNELVDRFAAGLQQLGLQPGDRVALHMPNCPQLVIAYYGTLRAGGIVVPSNPLYKAREVAHQVNDSGAKILVTLSLMYPKVKEARAATGLQHVIVANIKEYFPVLLKSLFTLAVERKSGHRVDISGDGGTLWFQDFIKAAPRKPSPVNIALDDTAVLMYTGGTTGVPKGAQLTHKNIVANAIQCAHWLSGLGSTKGTEVMMSALPLTHAYAMTICMNHAVFYGHAQILIPDPRNFEHFLNAINIHKPTILPAVPILVNRLNNDPNIRSGKYDVRSIKACICGAASLPVEVQQEFQRITGGKLLEGYGLSESSPVAIASPMAQGGRVGFIGVPFPDTDVKIVDQVTEEDVLDADQPGILCLSGPQVMKGYWNKLAETEEVLRTDATGKTWLHTGDVVAMTTDGYIRFVDRKKEVIIPPGGYNVYPREIEERLYEHPAVLEAAAIGVPMGDSAYQRIKVFVVIKAGESVTKSELIKWCRDGLAQYKVPKFVEFRAELPKTTIGKIFRRQLMDEEAEKARRKGTVVQTRKTQREPERIPIP